MKRSLWLLLMLCAACESSVDKYLRLQGELSSADAAQAYANYHADSIKAVRDTAPPGARRDSLGALFSKAFGDAMEVSRKRERIAAELHLMAR